MNTVYDVAKYVLEKMGPMSTMKLQKLCYYAQAWSLVWDDNPLFDEDFEAWANGPVCPELFEKHKGVFIVDESLFQTLPSCYFSVDEKETMDNVLEYYGDRKPYWLSELTRLEDPWKIARRGYSSGASCNVVISKESIQQYYGGL